MCYDRMSNKRSVMTEISFGANKQISLISNRDTKHHRITEDKLVQVYFYNEENIADAFQGVVLLLLCIRSVIVQFHI